MKMMEMPSMREQIIMTPSDLFDWTPPPTYPGAPGFKEPTTSRDAAEKIKPIARTLRDQALNALRVAYPEGLTADEVAIKLGRREFSVRPRLSELLALHAIERLAVKGVVQRRENTSGMPAIVWIAKRSYGDWE